MTIKELADFCNRDTKTVKRWIKKITSGQNVSGYGDKMSSGIKDKNLTAQRTGKPADYSIDEIEAILKNSSMSSDAISILMRNARKEPQETLTKRELDIISATVAVTVKSILSNLNIGNVQEEKRLLALPSGMDVRARINVIVKKYAFDHNIEVKSAWGELYRNYGYITHSNPCICAKKRGMKIIDYIEAEGQLEELELVARKMIA